LLLISLDLLLKNHRDNNQITHIIIMLMLMATTVNHLEWL